MDARTEAVAVAAWICGESARRHGCRPCADWITLDDGGDHVTTPPPDCHGARSARPDQWASSTEETS